MNRKTFIKTLSGAAVATVALTSVQKAEAKEIHHGATSSLREYKNWVSPLIYCVGKKVKVSIELQEHEKKNLDRLCIRCVSNDGLLLDNKTRLNEQKTPSMKFEISKDGKYAILQAKFLCEGRFVFDVAVKNKQGRVVFGKKSRRFLGVYALEQDYFELRPFKGDTHMHTKPHSDGRVTVKEAVVACLGHGMDYMSVSDHANYKGSQEAIAVTKDLPLHIKNFPAEEIHFSHMHMHSFGARESLTDYVKKHKKEFDNRIKEVIATLKDVNLSGFDKRALATLEVEAEYVHKLGGLCYLNHPGWRIHNWYDGKGMHSTSSIPLVQEALKRGKFDALELANGISSGEFTYHHYYRMLIDGKCKEMPIVGNSDGHGRNEYGTSYTIAFAKPSATLQDIKDAIMQKRTAVVDAVRFITQPNGNIMTTYYSVGEFNRPRIFGNTRNYNFANFLLEEYFPVHDALCEKEAEALDEYFKNPTDDAKANIAKCADAVKAFQKSAYQQI